MAVVIALVVAGSVLLVVVPSGSDHSPSAAKTVTSPQHRVLDNVLDGARTTTTRAGSIPSAAPATDQAPVSPASDAWSATGTYAASSLNLNAISCPSASQCYAVGETTLKSAMVLASADGGSTWTQQSVQTPGSLLAIACASPDTCAAVGGPSVLLTTDGGTTWTAKELGSIALTGVSCPTATLCVAVGSASPQTSGCASGMTYATRNGGQSWSPSSTRCFVPSSVACSSASNCLMSGTHTTGGAGYGAVMLSNSAGKVWQWNDVLRQPDTQLAAISCPSKEVCVAVGNSSRQPIVRTTNAGATWSSAAPGGTGANYLAVSCASTTACQAAGTQGAVSTADGTTWGAAVLPAPVLRVTGIACPTAGQCSGVAVGQNAAPWTIKLSA